MENNEDECDEVVDVTEEGIDDDLELLKNFFSVLHGFEDKLDDGESVIYWLYHKVNNC